MNGKPDLLQKNTKAIVRNVVIAIGLVVFCCYLLPWMAWVFDCWNLICIIQIIIASVSGLVVYIALMSFLLLIQKTDSPRHPKNWLKSKVFPYPIFNLLALLIICVVTTISVVSMFNSYGYHAPKRWGNCMSSDNYIYSKFGNKILFAYPYEGLDGVYRVYDENVEKCFLVVKVVKEEQDVNSYYTDYDKQINLKLYAKVYDGNGNYVCELEAFEQIIYEYSWEYRNEHRDVGYYKYNYIYVDDNKYNLTGVVKDILVKYIIRENYSLAEDYGIFYTGKKTIKKTKSYTINVSTNPDNGGTVSGYGTYKPKDDCTITATANSGYKFINWTENDCEVSNENTYTFKVTENRELKANFKKKSIEVRKVKNKTEKTVDVKKTEDGLLYEGDYTQGNLVSQITGMSMPPFSAQHHIKIYEDHLEDCGNWYFEGVSGGKRIYKNEFVSINDAKYYVDGNYNITEYRNVSSQYGFESYVSHFTKGNVTFDVKNQTHNYNGSDNHNHGTSQPSTGKTAHQVTKDCPLCHGSGKCNTCNGKHWYYGFTGERITCPNCKPNGACSKCGGSGKITVTEWY